MKLPTLSYRQAVVAAAGAAALAVMAAVAGYFMALRPVDVTDQAPVVFAVESGESPSAIAARLEERGLIRSRYAFLLHTVLTGKRSKLQVGAYAFQPAFSSSRIATMLAGGEVDQAKLVIAEGLRASQIADAAKRAGIDGLAEAYKDSYDFEFLKGRPPGQGLEGYLFPDTYLVSRDADPQSVVRLMLENFDRRVTADLRQKLTAKGLTLHQAITLASMVEREAGRAEDMPKIAQVFLKRLQIGMKLDSDVTVQFGAGLEPDQQAQTAAAIINSNSPYNTYKFAGLPPGPICSPGIKAMEAVVNPAATDFLYFVADRDGVTYFARTFDEHQANIRTHR